MARINLRKFIAEHYRAGVSARDVIREAVTNSIQAGAKHVSIDLHFSDRQVELPIGLEERRFLERIEIIDDGVGFTPENLNYFEEVCTNHKDSIGGKGVGRLAYLKYAEKVTITSQLANSHIEFDYTPDFQPNEVARSDVKGTPRTSIVLSQLKDKINTHVTRLVNGICDDVRLLLFLRSKSSQDVLLTFTHNSGQPFDEHFTFSSRDIHAEVERKFELSGEEFECYLFREEAPSKGVVALLCADQLCVEEYSISKRFDICRYIISVTSDYFNKRSDIERQRLELPRLEEDADMVSQISREKLMPRIEAECLAMIEQTAAGAVESFRAGNVDKLRKFYPFINIDSLGGQAAFLDADDVVRTYRAQQARREDQVVDALESGRKPSWDDISHLASEDLARFIVHRALVIDSLANLPPASAEDAIHDAILPRRSDGSDIRDNNVWLVDDKFLSYSSIFSDETLSRIVREVTDAAENEQNRRPDVAAFFSRDNENRPNKLVVVEFKKPGADIFENNKALVQCRLYAGKLADKIPSVREIFAFSVVEIDEDFYKDMKQTGFKDVFSLSERVVYNDYQVGSKSEVPMHLYVMPASTLVKDAKARNRVFEEVLRLDTTMHARPKLH